MLIYLCEYRYFVWVWFHKFACAFTNICTENVRTWSSYERGLYHIHIHIPQIQIHIHIRYIPNITYTYLVKKLHHASGMIVYYFKYIYFILHTTYHIPYTIYHIPHITYHIPHTTYHIPLHTTYHYIPHTTHEELITSIRQQEYKYWHTYMLHMRMSNHIV